MKNFLKTFLWVIFFVLIGKVAFAAVVEEGDRVHILSNIQLENPVKGDLVTIFGNISASYNVEGDIVTIFGNVDVQSAIKGDVVAVLGTVNLGPEANIQGDLVSVGIGGIQKAPGAKISGDTVGINFGSIDFLKFNSDFMQYKVTDRFTIGGLIEYIIFIIIAVFSLLTVSVAGERVNRLVIRVECCVLKKVFKGIAAFLTLIFIVPLLIITIIGFPIAIIYYFIAFLLGFTGLSVYTGKKVLDLLNCGSNMYGEFFVGIIILACIIFTLRVPVWPIVPSLVVILSLGIAFDGKFGRR